MTRVVYAVGDTFRRTRDGVRYGRVHTVARTQTDPHDVYDEDGVAHLGDNIELVARAAVMPPATLEQVQEIVRRANATNDARTLTGANPEGIRVGDRVRRTRNTGAGGEFDIGAEFIVSRVDTVHGRLCVWSEAKQGPDDYHYVTNVSLVQAVNDFRPGDRVRRKDEHHGNRGGNYDNGEPFTVDVTHSTRHNGREVMCALDLDGRHHVFENLERATELPTTTMVPMGWTEMEPWEQDLLNPFQVGDIVRRKPGSGDSDVDFTISELGRDSGRSVQNPAARMTTTGEEWHHLTNLVLQRRPEPATVETNNNPTTTEGNIMQRVPNGTRVQRQNALLNPNNNSHYYSSQLAWEVTDSDIYAARDPHGASHSWGSLELATGVRVPTPEETEAGFYPGDVVEHDSGREFTVDRVAARGSFQQVWFTTNTYSTTPHLTLVRRGPNAPTENTPATTDTPAAVVRVPGLHGFAVGDIVRTRAEYVVDYSAGRRKNQEPWTVDALDSDEWPMSEGNYYNPAQLEMVTEFGTPEPEAERIELNDPRVAWFWEAAAKAADEEGFCPEYERLAARLGVPGRVHKFRCTATVRGQLAGSLSMEVDAENARAAREKLVEALGGSPVAGRFDISISNLS